MQHQVSRQGTAPAYRGVHDPKPLTRFAPSLAVHQSLDCGLLRIGESGWLVFFGGQVQGSDPFPTRLAAIDELGRLERVRAQRQIEAAAAAVRG